MAARPLEASAAEQAVAASQAFRLEVVAQEAFREEAQHQEEHQPKVLEEVEEVAFQEAFVEASLSPSPEQAAKHRQPCRIWREA